MSNSNTHNTPNGSDCHEYCQQIDVHRQKTPEKNPLDASLGNLSITEYEIFNRERELQNDCIQSKTVGKGGKDGIINQASRDMEFDLDNANLSCRQSIRDKSANNYKCTPDNT